MSGTPVHRGTPPERRKGGREGGRERGGWGGGQTIRGR